MKDNESLHLLLCILLLITFSSAKNALAGTNVRQSSSVVFDFTSQSSQGDTLLPFSKYSAGYFQAPLQADSPVFNHIQTIEIEAKNIQTDRLGNLYVVSKTNQLYKYGPGGKLLSTLNYKYLGNITHVDATNPLEIYVFYKELNMVVFLDNNLAYRGEMKLSDYGIGQAGAVCRSFDNGIWIFDLGDLQLKKMDKNGENLLTTGNIKQYVSQPGAVLFLYDDNEKVYVNDSANGVIMFNIFGTYAKTLPIRGCTEIKVISDEVYYWQIPLLKKYRQKSFDTQQFTLPDAMKVTDVSIEKGRIYLLKSDRVSIYGF